MLGVLITLAVVAGCAGIGAALFRRWTEALDPALRFGTEGLLGLGVLGTLTLFIGLLPSGLGWGVYVVGAYALVGLVLLVSKRQGLRLTIPRGPSAIGLLLLVVLGLFTLVAVLAPSTTDDWDTLAYHLAVPKLWLAEGHIYSVPYISHSNFPDVIDDLYVWGLTWGSQQGAKAFSLGFFLLGTVAIFGFARQRYGANAGWWAAAAFATVPTVLWESGTAYIDVGHGLFAGLGLAFAALAIDTEDRRSQNTLLSALLLGFAAASKYTGVETLLIAAFLIFVYGQFRLKSKHSLKAAAAVVFLGGAIAAPWYIKNIVNVGNPVYPFLYERFGGAHWDQRRADIYRGEQATFGVAQTDKGKNPAQIGHSVLGLAYQPGRYVNPQQTTGGGSPMGALGVAVLAAFILWAVSGKARRFEGFILAASGLTFLGWFFLSQQSRYIAALVPPASILLGGAIYAFSGSKENTSAKSPLKALGLTAAAVTVFQALYTLWLFQSNDFTDQSQVVLGKVSTDEYQSKRNSFYAPSKTINQLVAGGKVALYDEVFGYLLDVPYFWANPGHTTVIPYDSMQNADDYVREMKRLGFTHIYINPSLKDPEYAPQWIASMGLNGPAQPLPPDVRKRHFDDWQTKWEILVSDAAAQQKLVPEATFGRKVLFRIE